MPDHPFPLPPTPEVRQQWFAAIHRRCIERSPTIRCANFTAVADSDLKLLFSLYDEAFFAGALAARLPSGFSFSFSRRLTRAAGRVAFHRVHGPRQLCLSVTLLFQSFHDVSRPVTVAGITCQDRLEAAMRILEHELVHLVEFFLHGETSCGKPRFKALARELFGHTASAHQLISQRERAATAFNIRLGDRVRFEYDGRRLTGIVHRITRRATVMVPSPDGDYRDRAGNSYRKYYVPLSALTLL